MFTRDGAIIRKGALLLFDQGTILEGEEKARRVSALLYQCRPSGAGPGSELLYIVVSGAGSSTTGAAGSTTAGSAAGGGGVYDAKA